MSGTISYTSNLGLNKPGLDYTLWDVPVNLNSDILDYAHGVVSGTLASTIDDLVVLSDRLNSVDMSLSGTVSDLESVVEDLDAIYDSIGNPNGIASLGPDGLLQLNQRPPTPPTGVSSVNGLSGTVVLSSTNLADSSSLVRYDQNIVNISGSRFSANSIVSELVGSGMSVMVSGTGIWLGQTIAPAITMLSGGLVLSGTSLVVNANNPIFNGSPNFNQQSLFRGIATFESPTVFNGMSVSGTSTFSGTSNFVGTTNIGGNASSSTLIAQGTAATLSLGSNTAGNVSLRAGAAAGTLTLSAQNGSFSFNGLNVSATNMTFSGGRPNFTGGLSVSGSTLVSYNDIIASGSSVFRGDGSGLVNVPVSLDQNILALSGTHLTKLSGNLVYSSSILAKQTPVNSIVSGTVLNVLENLHTLVQSNGSGGVSTVNGMSGTVVLTTDDIAEGDDNLYFTNQRVSDAVSGTNTLRRKSETPFASMFAVADLSGLSHNVILDYHVIGGSSNKELSGLTISSSTLASGTTVGIDILVTDVNNAFEGTSGTSIFNTAPAFLQGSNHIPLSWLTDNSLDLNPVVLSPGKILSLHLDFATGGQDIRVDLYE